MKPRAGRILLLALLVVAVFAVVALVMFRLIPAPHKDTDYLVIGTVATFVALLVLFVVLLKTWVKQPDVFFKRRNKPDHDS